MAVGKGGATLGDGGIAEVGGSSYWFRGRGFVWASEGSNIAPLPTHIFTSSQENLPQLLLHHFPSSPQEPMEPEASVPTEQALESTSSTAPSVGRKIPANMQPLCIQLGSIKHVYQCQVEGCREGPSTSHATICAPHAKDIPGSGVGVHPLQQVLFQPLHLQVPQERSLKYVYREVVFGSFCQ